MSLQDRLNRAVKCADLNAITKAANSGKFQIALHVVGRTREFVLNELVKLIRFKP